MDTATPRTDALFAQQWDVTATIQNAHTLCCRLELELIANAERAARLEAALRGLLEVCHCTNDCPPDDMTCATNVARQALGGAK